MVKKIKETDIQLAICDYLALKGYFFWRANNTAIFDPTRRVFRAMPKYGMKGIPDIQIILNEGRSVFLEVKTPKGVQSDSQKEFESKCKSKGVQYYVVRSLDDIMEIGL